MLTGARTNDLSVEHPMRFELTINLKTGKALNLDISAALRPGDRMSHASFVVVHESASGTSQKYHGNFTMAAYCAEADMD